MIYTFFTSVFLTFFFLVGALSFFGFTELWRKNFPLSWTCYQHVIILAVISALCFIVACLFGTQIPDCYAPTTF